jgi:formylglycine-generating enzyme required for sulfatase activity
VLVFAPVRHRMSSMAAAATEPSRKVETAVPRVVPVPGGRFLMGCEAGRDDERPVHAVELERFEIGRTPVTRAEYAAFLCDERATPPPWWTVPAFSHPDQPVVGVTWWESVAYADWLSRTQGRTWRLPSEAEWERAARGGLPSAATPWGEALPPGEVPVGPLEAPWPVGHGTPNGFGMMDAGTVVHEWCSDWYRPDAYRPGGPRAQTRPGVARRSSRGGSWRHRVRWSPPSARSSLPPAYRYADYGFRVVRELS